MKKLLLILFAFGFCSWIAHAQSDNCASATMLNNAQTNCALSNQNVSGTTVGSTPETVNFVGCINATVESGVWYRFQAQGPDIEILDMSGHVNAPYVAILPDNCASAAYIICQQLDILDQTAEGDDILTTGDFYLLWIGYQGGTNTYDICISNPPAPANDLCANAIDITGSLECVTGSSSTVTGTTAFSSPDGWDYPGCLNPGTNSWEGVWYSFTAQGYDFVVDDIGGNAPHIILHDAGCAGGTFIYCGQTPVDLTTAPDGDNLLTIGQQYHMWVGFDGGLEEDFELCIDNPVPPVNDECVNAINIQANIHCVIGGADPVEGTIYGAFPDDQVVAGTCIPAAANGWEGIWYTFTSEGHDLIIESSGTEDPYIILYDGCPLGGNPVYCGQTPIDLGSTNDATGNPTNNFLALDEVPMQLWMWVGFDGGLDEDFSICVENPPPPPNDICINAIDITNFVDCPASTGSVLGTTNYSTPYQTAALNQYVWPPNAPGVTPDCFDPFVDEAVWYTFTAPGVDFEINDNMGGNPSFAILTYNECMNGAELIICDDMPFTFSAEDDPDDLFNVGQVYLLMVAFPGGWMATDSFDLCVNIPEPPPNDLCENAIPIDGFLDCPEISSSLVGWTTNASQDGTYWSNFDPLLLPCMLDTTEDDGVWYQFTAIGTDLVIEDNAGNNPTILLMNFNNCIDTISFVMCETVPFGADFGEPGNNALTIGNNYLMYITFQGGETESDTFDICIDNDGMCSSPTPPSSYCQTTPLCGLAALDAYCMNMEVNSADENWPGCSVFLHDPNWFSFVAGADNLSIQVQVSDCQTGTGVQIEMYEIDCTTDLGPNEPFCPASDLGPPLANCIYSETPQPPGSAPIFTVPTEFGHVYGIVFDGWAGDLCTIEINVLQGADPPSLDGVTLPEPEWDPTAFPFEGDTICAGAEDVRFAIDEDVVGACRYDWTVNGEPIVDGTNDLEEFIDFPLPGIYDVCFFASNFCDSTDPVCVQVVVAALDPFITYDTICEGDPYVWLGPFGEPLPFDPPFDSEEGGQYAYQALATNLAGCEVEAYLYLEILEENDDNPTPIDTVICVDDAPFTFWSNDPIPINATTGVLEDFELNRQLSHGGMCDSFFILDLYSLDAIIIYDVVRPPLDQLHVNCVDSVITVCPLMVGGNPFFAPDPNLYPDVEIHYTWVRLPFLDTVGTDSICLVIDFDDFETNEQSFEVHVTMTKGGHPAGGCIFGPFDVDLVLLDFIPDVSIIGPDTVCIGPEFEFTILPFVPEDNDVWPAPIDYFWDLSNFPGATREEITEFTSSFTFSEAVTGLICVTALHPCSNSPERCKEVVVVLPPPGDPGLDDEECTNTYMLNAGNSIGTWFPADGPIGASIPIFGDVNSPSTDVTIIEKGEYTFGWITFAYGCNDTSYVEIDFIEPMSLDGSIAYQCDEVHETYMAVFDFAGGIAPFVVTSNNGTLSGMTFTSDPINQGDTTLVLITDDQGCVGSWVLTQECACLTEPAVMNLNLIESCGETCIQVSAFSDAVLDANDTFVYVLHSSNTDVLGSVIEENHTGEFCLTNGGAIQYDVIYYVSILAGNALGSTVDLDHRCTQLAPGQPVVWYEIPAPNAGVDDATCDDFYQLNALNINYPGSWEIVTSTTNVTFSDQTSPNSGLTALGCGVVKLRWVEINQICHDTSTVTIEFYCNPINTTPVPSCNMAQTELTFNFQLNGVGPFAETNGRGTVIGNEYELTGILLPMTAVDTLFFVDGNGCELVVPLQIADCNCLPLLVPDTVCGLSIVLESDGTGNGGFWEISPISTGPGIATISTPNMRMTNVSVTEYGTYCFRWTEVGNLCTSFGDVCIPFVKRPEIDMSSIVFTCNANYDGYTISFNIFDGDVATYVIFDENGLPLGQIVGNTFTSREFPSNQPISIRLSDGFMCDTVVLDTLHDCGCFTGIGNLDDTPLNLCVEDVTSVNYDATFETADGNDVLIFILYSDINDPLNSILAESPSGVFGFMDPPMTRGTTYYISAVLGTESFGGNVDYTDPCISISPPLPVTWYDRTVPIISKSEEEFTCLILQMMLGVSSSDDINDYDVVWTTSNGLIQSGDENLINPRINSPGTYTVTLSHRIAGCASSESITIDQSDDVPEATIQQPQQLTCNRLQVSVSGVGSDTGPTIRYVWSGPGIVGTDTTLTILVDQIGTYTLTLIDDANGCMISETITVSEDVTDPVANASVAELLDCNTTQVNVTGQGSAQGGNISYSWSVVGANGNIVGSANGRDIVVDAPGVYEIEVTNNTNGCISTATVQVDEDDSVISGATIELRQPGCDGLDDGQINITSVNGGTSPFMYSFNGGVDFGTQPSMTDLGHGVYDIVITDNNGCIHNETVILTEAIDFFVDLGETILIEFGDTAYVNGITDLSDSLTQSITWTPLYDTANQGQLYQQFVPDLGQYSVNLTIINTNGCVEQDNVLVVVKFAERIYIPTAMYPSSSNPQNNRIYIFANPESVAAISSFAIYNRWGERMFERSDIPPSLTIDPTFAWDGVWQDELAPTGVYVYYAEVEFITGVKKIIKGEFTLLR